MIFFFKQLTLFFKKYKIFKTLFVFKKYVLIILKNIKFSYTIEQDLAKESKVFCATLLKHYNSNFIKQIIYLYTKELLKNKRKTFVAFFKRVIKYLYIFYYLKKLQKQCLLLNSYFLIKIKICLIKNKFYLLSHASIFLLPNILSLNFYGYPKNLFISKEKVGYSKYFLLQKSYKVPKNLFTILEKRKIKKFLYSRPLNWLMLYNEIQIFFFFEMYIYKILSSNRLKDKVVVLLLIRLFEKSFLLTVAKKKKFSMHFCLSSFKPILYFLKKKKKVILFEKC